MDSRFSWPMWGAILVGGAAMLGYPWYAPCLRGYQELELEQGDAIGVGCMQSDRLAFAAWDHGAKLELVCESGPHQLLLREGVGTEEACDSYVELTGHWKDRRTGVDVISLYLEW